MPSIKRYLIKLNFQRLLCECYSLGIFLFISITPLPLLEHLCDKYSFALTTLLQSIIVFSYYYSKEFYSLSFDDYFYMFTNDFGLCDLNELS